jgi:Sigma-70, region 4.
MLRNTLKRQARADLLRRLEISARTVEEFEEVVDMYDKLDANRERRERYNELSQSEYSVQYAGSKLTFIETGQAEEPSDDDSPESAFPESAQLDKPKKYIKKEKVKNHVYNEGAIIPPPLNHPYWKELLRGDFISYIFDNYMEVWQILGDWQVGRLYRNELTAKQKEALFLRAVCLATTEQIGCYKDISDRAVRRLLAAALENIRKPLAVMIQQRLDDKLPVTLEKRRFLEWYEQQQKQIEQKETPGDKPDES